MRKTVNGTSQMYYVLTDHLGSIDAVVPAVSGVMPAVEYYSFDAWGNRRDPYDWTQTDTRTSFITDRGFTGHEHLDAFGLINANGRIYEPATGRFLSPDNYVQAPDFSQSFNRYAYGYNNPMMFTDPDGENPLVVAAIIIGAAAGGYTGYRIAESKGYDMDDWQTYAYMVGGAAIGGFSAYAGSVFAAGGGFMANTAGIIGSSAIYSMGMTPLSSGRIAPNISFGAASFNMGTGEFGYIGQHNNKWYQDMGYGFGALANIQDIFAGFNGGNYTYDFEDPHGKPGHAMILRGKPNEAIPIDKNGHVVSMTIDPSKIVISVANKNSGYGGGFLNWKYLWRSNFRNKSGGPEFWTGAGEQDPVSSFGYKIPLYNVANGRMNAMQNNLNNMNGLFGIGRLRFGAFFGCSSHAARALWRVGIPTIPVLNVFGPSVLYSQLFIRQFGIYANPFLTSN